MIKKNIYWIAGLCLVLFFCLNATEVEAQCAMCRASVESGNGESGDSIANGLNKGILYLMAIPYLLVGCIGFFWYKYSKKQK